MTEKIINHKQQPINGQPSGLKISQKRSMQKVVRRALVVVLVVISGIITTGLIWYNIQLSPVGSDISHLTKITVAPGSTSTQIGKELKKQSIIRSATAFDIYVRLSCKNKVLQAGTYRLSPAEPVAKIVEHFVNGSVDKFTITFYPGATLTDNTNKPASKKLDVTSVLRRAGFSDSEIKTALQQQYDGPLFSAKPLDANLEGYIYGETYNFNAGSSVDEILKGTFKEFYAKIQENNLVKGFSDHGLNLYQGITLASIVQREIISPLGQQPSADQTQAAQVFYSRLSLGMPLGSDVTYQYIADKTGLARDPNLDSAYNTRNSTGLPPGPIAVPGITALLAVAHPANSDYLYFLSGDDDVTYFAKTNAEHEANITKHCKIKCSAP